MKNSFPGGVVFLREAAPPSECLVCQICAGLPGKGADTYKASKILEMCEGVRVGGEDWRKRKVT